MSKRRIAHRRRTATPPKEGVLTNVLGKFLDPIDALIAIFFSILFALLFTLSYSIFIFRGLIDTSYFSGYGQDLFVAIIGVITAWGIIDGVIYALSEYLMRGERYRLLQYIHSSDDEETAVAAIADELDFILEPITSEEQRQALYHDMLAHLSQAEPQAVGLQREDLIGGTAMVLVSVIAVLPSLLPLLLLPQNTELAIRISNVVSFFVIFATGYSWGIHTGANPLKIGFFLASICFAMVFVAMLLGG